MNKKKSETQGKRGCPALPSLNDASAWSTDRFLRIAPRPNMKLPSQCLTFRCSTHLALLVRPLLLMYYSFFFLSFTDLPMLPPSWSCGSRWSYPVRRDCSRWVWRARSCSLSLFLCVRPPPSLFPPPPFRVKSIFPSFPPFIGSPDPSRRRGR